MTTLAFPIDAGATISELIETGTQLLIEKLQRPVSAVIVDTRPTDDPLVYEAVVEAREVRPVEGRTEVRDVLTDAFQGLR